MIVNNATTIWEDWKYDDYIGSHNHPMYGSVSQWFLQSLAGIRPGPDAVAFDTIFIAPRPLLDQISTSSWLKASYNSVRGPIYVTWNLIPNNSSMVHKSPSTSGSPLISETSSSLPPLSPLSCPPTKLGGIVLEDQVLTLQCGDSTATILSIDFASYGTPTGDCPNYTAHCQAASSLSVVQKLCLGKNTCSITASNLAFSVDPCPNVVKRLAVVASGCTPQVPPQFVLDVTIPANTIASVRLPTNPYFIANATVSPTLNGVTVEGGRAILYQIRGGGSYHFTSRFSP